MQPDSKIKDSVQAEWWGRQSASSLAFVQSDHKNLYLVNTVYPILQKTSAKVKRRIKERAVTKPLCDLPDTDLKRYKWIKPVAVHIQGVK